MAEPEQPQLYLITPREIALSTFPDQLAAILDATEIACVRMALSSPQESVHLKAGDALREVTHARDIPLVIEQHVQLAERLGLDGVHLADGAKSVRATRKALGADAIVGTFCGNSRHDGMTAGESGADYVAFGPISQSALGDGSLADAELFTWWSEMIEVPVIAEGRLTMDKISELRGCTDFFAIGPEIWSGEDPAAELTRLIAPLGQT